MIKTRAPLRISFAGGGTDIEPYCSEYGGMVLSAAIQKYAYAETTRGKAVSGIERTIADCYPEYTLYPHIQCDAPPMSGLGGSAACFVAGIKAMAPGMTPGAIYKLAFHLEREVMVIAGGKQDQMASAFGGFNYMTFGPGKTEKVESLDIPEHLESLLFLVYMGERKNQGADIIKDQMQRGNLDNFEFQKKIVVAMKDALRFKNLRSFGQMILMAWLSKLQYSPYIANTEIKDFNRECLQNGAIGGKLPGAGGGGYMMLMADPDNPDKLPAYLKKKNVKYETVKFDMEGVKCL
jgi:D-glycero-alpha-D-manno-heptose-7-phosphate kinase